MGIKTCCAVCGGVYETWHEENPTYDMDMYQPHGYDFAGVPLQASLFLVDPLGQQAILNRVRLILTEGMPPAGPDVTPSSEQCVAAEQVCIPCSMEPANAVLCLLLFSSCWCNAALLASWTKHVHAVLCASVSLI